MPSLWGEGAFLSNSNSFSEFRLCYRAPIHAKPVKSQISQGGYKLHVA
jgi:hypothetical protein